MDYYAQGNDTFALGTVPETRITVGPDLQAAEIGKAARMGFRYFSQPAGVTLIVRYLWRKQKEANEAQGGMIFDMGGEHGLWMCTAFLVICPNI